MQAHVPAAPPAGTTMTVPLIGVTDVQTLTITLTGVTDASSQVLPTTPVSGNMLIGDVNGDKKVNNTDVSVTRGQVGMAVTIENFREDVRISGTITSADPRAVQGGQRDTGYREYERNNSEVDLQIWPTESPAINPLS